MNLSRAQVERAGLPGPGEEPHFLPHPLMDRLLEAVIVLGGEFWIERDRRRALESLLHSKGLVTPEEIETHSETDSEGRQGGVDRPGDSPARSPPHHANG